METLRFFETMPRQKFHFRTLPLFCALLLFGGMPEAIAQTSVTNSKPFLQAKAIRVKEFTLKESTLLSAVNALNQIARTNNSQSKGIYVLLQDAARLTTEAKLTLSLKDVSLAEALERLCLSANLKLEAKGSYLSLNTLQPVQVEYLTFDMISDRRPDMQKLKNEGWQMFSTTHEPRWVGGADKPEQYILTFCRKKPALVPYAPPL
jgi:hypothetical protein